MILDSQFSAPSKEDKYPLLFGETKVNEISHNEKASVNSDPPEDKEVLKALEDILIEVKETLQPERSLGPPRPLSPSLTQQPVEFHSRSVRHQNWIEVIKEPLFKM